ncbi:MAG: hypothetical protein L3K17_09430 [Thermoplasmata archaeon]|nr:hypothetical protein [Thermoplasmata archaeon]
MRGTRTATPPPGALQDNPLDLEEHEYRSSARAGQGSDHYRPVHRSLRPRRSSPPLTETEPVIDVLPASEPERSFRQRCEDAAPMVAISATCFLLAVYLRASDGPGSVPALPIWTLFLALGCIASLGAGASFVLGNSEPTAPAPPARRTGRHPTTSPDPRSPDAPHSTPSLSDEADDQLPAIPWGRPSHSMTASSRRRPAPRLEPEPEPEEPVAAPRGRPNAGDVIDEIDRMLDELRPANLRRRPSA